MNILDRFLEYLYLVEENTAELTTQQVQRLESIKDKVTELVKKVESCASQLAPHKADVHQKHHELAIRENQVHRFSEFTELNEKISKRGGIAGVTDKSGKKVLGTHSSRKRAISQLPEIEISERNQLSNKLYTFSKFILERADRDIGAYYSKQLDKLDDNEVIDKLAELTNVLNQLESDYWYNRESRGSIGDHYALDMKIHSWPKIEKWAQIKGIDELDHNDEDRMNNDWNRFMEDTYEVHAEDYVESFSWIKKVGAGGRSGGWLLIYPKTNHDNIEDDTSYYLEAYLNNVHGDVTLDFIKSYIENPEFTELVELGLVNDEDFEDAGEALAARTELIEWINQQLPELYQVQTDLAKIKSEIQDFKNSAEEFFYEWLY